MQGSGTAEKLSEQAAAVFMFRKDMAACRPCSSAIVTACFSPSSSKFERPRNRLACDLSGRLVCTGACLLTQENCMHVSGRCTGLGLPGEERYTQNNTDLLDGCRQTTGCGLPVEASTARELHPGPLPALLQSKVGRDDGRWPVAPPARTFLARLAKAAGG
jgi:hypothetical protein